MSGILAEGWGFVWAAYGLTAAVLGAYVVSVLRRHGVEARRPDHRGAW
jgi:heme exporter protein D